jgi:hypothetical protein
MLENLPPERAREFEQAMLDLMARNVQDDGHLRDDREYLLVTGIRR